MEHENYDDLDDLSELEEFQETGTVEETVQETEQIDPTTPLEGCDFYRVSIAEQRDDLYIPFEGEQRISGVKALDNAINYLEKVGSTRDAYTLRNFKGEIQGGTRTFKADASQLPLRVKSVSSGVLITFQGKGDNGNQ